MCLNYLTKTGLTLKSSKEVMYFPDRECVRTLLTVTALYIFKFVNVFVRVWTFTVCNSLTIILKKKKMYAYAGIRRQGNRLNHGDVIRFSCRDDWRHLDISHFIVLLNYTVRRKMIHKTFIYMNCYSSNNGSIQQQEAQLPLRNRASAMHFFAAKLLSVAVMTYSYVYHLRNLIRQICYAHSE